MQTAIAGAREIATAVAAVNITLGVAITTGRIVTALTVLDECQVKPA
jgi:hypothetical protein